MTQQHFWDSEGLQILTPSTDEELEAIHLNGGCLELSSETLIRLTKAEDMLNELIDAWEALPGGRHYSVSRVSAWLEHDMTNAINKARAMLGRPKPGSAT